MEFNYFSGINHLYSRAKSILLPLLRVIGTFISNELSNCITWKACQLWILQHRWKDICCFKLLDMMRMPLPLSRNKSSLSKINNKPSLVLMIHFCSCWFCQLLISELGRVLFSEENRNTSWYQITCDTITGLVTQEQYQSCPLSSNKRWLSNTRFF